MSVLAASRELFTLLMDEETTCYPVMYEVVPDKTCKTTVESLEGSPYHLLSLFRDTSTSDLVG